MKPLRAHLAPADRSAERAIGGAGLHHRRQERFPVAAGVPINATVGNLFYGSEGWASMDDMGFQAYKGESSELVEQAV